MNPRTKRITKKKRTGRHHSLETREKISQRHTKIIEQSIIDEICELFKNQISIEDLRKKFHIGRNKITAILRKELGDDYRKYAILVQKSCSRKGWDRHPVRKMNWKDPEKIKQSYIQRGLAQRGKVLSEEQRQKISEGVKKTYETFDEDKKKSMYIHIVETKRKNGYFEIHGKRHSDWMKKNNPTKGKKANAKTRRLQSEAKKRFFENGGIPSQLGRKRSFEECKKMSERTKKMWVDGKFSYGNGTVFRSKIEIALYEELLKHYPDAQHSFLVTTPEKAYSFDIYLPTLNLLVEVNGDYWHFNPIMYKATHYDKYRNVCAKDVWEADDKKHKAAQMLGFKTAQIWELT